MINRKTLGWLAAITAALFVANGLIGSGKDVLWIVDDVLFFSFLLAVPLLIGMSTVVLVRSARRR
jgi:hypothetical protein